MFTSDLYRLYTAIGASRETPGRAQANARIAEARLARSDWRGALETYEEMRNDLAADPKASRAFLGASLNRGLALTLAQRLDEAEPVLKAVLDLRAELLDDDHYGVAEAHGALALLHSLKGDQAGALKAFREVSPTLIQGAMDHATVIPEPGAHRTRLQIILEGYLNLLARTQAAGDDSASEAFKIAQALQEQAAQKAVASSAARAHISDPDLATLVRKEQGAQQRIKASAALLSRLLAEGTGDAAQLTGLKKRKEQLKLARTALLEEIRKRYPDFDQLVRPKTLTLAEAQNNLRPGEALLFPSVGMNNLYVWAVPHRGKPVFAMTETGAEEVTALVKRVRAALNPDAETLDQIMAFDTQAAHHLFQVLMKPVEAGWKEAKVLTIAPQGPLASLPFSVLLTKPGKPGVPGAQLFAEYRDLPWLAKEKATVYLPSMAALHALRAMPPGKPNGKPFLAFVDPRFGQSDELRTAQLETRGGSTRLQRRALRVTSKGSLDEKEVQSGRLSMLAQLPETADEVTRIARP